MKIPGLIDPHVHFREPGATYKEDYQSGSAAALAGGFTTVLVMPNTDPPLTNQQALMKSAALAKEKSYCDYGIYLGGTSTNAEEISQIADKAVGLKLYLDATFGPLLLEDLTSWMTHFQVWPQDRPLVAHAEGKTLSAYLFFAALYQRPVHVCHVSRKEEIVLIREAKKKGFPVTCEVAPHHLFLTKQDVNWIGKNRAQVKPELGTSADRQALWDNLEYIDCFATDHAPHTLAEKDSAQPPPGFPGLETALPLMLTAVAEGRLTMEDLIEKMVNNPRKIFSLSEQPETWVEIERDREYTLQAAEMKTKCAWTPFEGMKVRGGIRRVVLRGKVVYEQGKIAAEPGSGINIRETKTN